ncbi:hypothetical protein DLAC_04216 [Tieghemostelium lacteum]|uniref:Uncharacterized protein n=1 Tax=Tieghemostelium lacteum TaxID=361077 RepID=A0A151ZSJ0_TIELA|nr:hypothetical protein DLAC_04216 [Tieghemostelium lacteum]|eukprot:KYQ96899.1 hypothetical protein DLAC_04216 [Tieghemostelium lacteum]
MEPTITTDKEKEFIELLQNASPSDKLALFFNLQEQRSSINNKFNDGFKTFLKNSDEKEYQDLCTSVTTLLSNISKEIIKIEESLQSSHPKWSLVIKDIRELEKQKFILTTHYQILKTEINANTQLQKEHNFSEGNCFNEHVKECENKVTIVHNEIFKYTEMIIEKLDELKYELNDYFNSIGEYEPTPNTNTKCSHDHDHSNHHH